MDRSNNNPFSEQMILDWNEYLGTFEHLDNSQNTTKNCKERNFVCNICLKAFIRKDHLKRHLQAHSGLRPFGCDTCHKSFATKANLAAHMATHNSQKLFMCFVCDKSFTIKYNLFRHMVLHSGEKPFKCDICGKVFASKTYLKNHSAIHTGIKPFRCHICGKGFTHKCKLLKHFEIHSKSGRKPRTSVVNNVCSNVVNLLSDEEEDNHGAEMKSLNCEVCGKTFNSKPVLLKHIMTHTEEKPYKCSSCHKSFSTPEFLKRHAVVHTGKKPYKCETCKRSFFFQGSLIKHLFNQKCKKLNFNRNSSSYPVSSQENSETFTCEVCKAQFIREDFLLKHLMMHTEESYQRQMHKRQSTAIMDVNSNNTVQRFNGRQRFGVPNYESQLYNRRTYAYGNHMPNYNNTGMYNSYTTVQGPNGAKSFVCNMCQKSFPRKDYLQRHLIMHTGMKPFVCNICKKSFVTKYTLAAHVALHNNQKLYTCNVCGKSFSVKYNLIRHMIVHNHEKPFKCDMCGKCFASKPRLKNHLAIHIGIKPFECNLCRKRFSHKCKLVKHMNVHFRKGSSNGLNPRSWMCLVCRENFCRQSDLLVHIAVHTKDKPFKCFVCWKPFYTYDCLSRHMAEHPGGNALSNQTFIHHQQITEPRPSKSGNFSNSVNDQTPTSKERFFCEVCKKRFSHKHPLMKHLMRHTEERPYVCEVCNKSFTSKEGLFAHVKTHSGVRSFICYICSKGFLTKAHLTTHLVVHSTLKPFTCTVCGRGFTQKFNLERHKAIHTGMKKFSCETCHKSFIQKAHLDRHMSIHNDPNSVQGNLGQGALPRKKKMLDTECMYMSGGIPEHNRYDACRKLLSNNCNMSGIPRCNTYDSCRQMCCSNPCNMVNVPERCTYNDCQKFCSNPCNIGGGPEQCTYGDCRMCTNPCNSVPEHSSYNNACTNVFPSQCNASDVVPDHSEYDECRKFFTGTGNVIEVPEQSAYDVCRKLFGNACNIPDVSEQGMYDVGTKSLTNPCNNSGHVQPLHASSTSESDSCEVYRDNMYSTPDQMFMGTNGKQYGSEMCNRNFPSNGLMNSVGNNNVNNTSKLFHCIVCPKVFTFKKNLMRHVKRDHSGEGFADHSTDDSSSHAQPGLVPSQKEPFQCEICKKCFSSKDRVLHHLMLHTDERPFTCEVCGKSFTCKSHLATHMGIHARESMPQQGNFVKYVHNENNLLRNEVTHMI